MQNVLQNSIARIGLAAVLAAAIGFVAAAYLGVRHSFFRPAGDVAADCSIVADRGILGSTLRIRCGLDQQEIEAILNRALSELGLDEFQAGDSADTAALEAAAARFGLTVDAVGTLLANLRGTSPAEASAPRVQTAFEIALVDRASGARPGPDGAAGPPAFLAPERLVVEQTPPAAAETMLRRVRANCAVVAERIEDTETDLDCGPEPEEVTELIDSFVERSGAADLREALSRDASARQAFIADLGQLFQLDDALVSALIDELDRSEGLDAAAELDAALRAKLDQALLLLGMGQAAERLERDQVRIAAVIVGGEADPRPLFREAGERVGTLSQRLAPEEEPVLVAVHQALEASEALAAGNPEAAADAYAAAADQLGPYWPLLAAELRLAEIDARDRGERLSGRLLEAVTAERLRVADLLNDRALLTGLAAADDLQSAGDSLIDPSLLVGATEVLDGLAPLIDPEADPELEVRLRTALAITLMARGRRAIAPDLLQRAEAEADAALAAARGLEPDTESHVLRIWANSRYILGYRTDDAERVETALKTYERLVEANDPGGNTYQWAAAKINVAAASSTLADMTGDAGYLDTAIESLRAALGRLDRESIPDLWSLATGNLGGALRERGNWLNEPASVRLAIPYLQQMRTFHTDRGDQIMAARIAQSLAYAWRDIALMEQDPDAFAKAVEIQQSLVSALRDDESLAPSRDFAEALRGLANILANSTTLAPDAAVSAAAAKHYDDARGIITADVDPQSNALMAIYEATEIIKAGETVEGEALPEPEALALEALDLAKRYRGRGSADEWQRIKTSAQRLLEALKQ